MVSNDSNDSVHIEKKSAKNNSSKFYLYFIIGFEIKYLILFSFFLMNIVVNYFIGKFNYYFSKNVHKKLE